MTGGSKGFTIIELLIVVAIIGILAAVGVPMYQGYMTTAKINASKENHIRVKSYIANTFTRCAAGASAVQLYTDGKSTWTLKCSDKDLKSITRTFSTVFWYMGLKNPYKTSDAAVKVERRPQGVKQSYNKGTTYLYVPFLGNMPNNQRTPRISISTDVGDELANKDIWVDYVMKE